MNDQQSFWPLCSKLKLGRFVDLTHTFDSNIPRFESSSTMEVDELSTYQSNGFWVQKFHFEGQWGTHVDAPAHCQEGGRTVDQITLQEMVLPLVVINISEKVATNPDYILLVDDVLTWEDQHGRIPKGAFVAIRSDWSKRWPDDAAMHNYDERGIPHSPGFGLDALSYLYEDCEISASGHETFDPDAGFRAKETNWICEHYILSRDRYQIELLTNLDQCPPSGAIVFCTFPKTKNAAGFPARVFAICPTTN